MNTRKKILGICGSASPNSGNLAVLNFISKTNVQEFDLKIIDDLSVFPHFKTELTKENVPKIIAELRQEISDSDGVIICTPEYVFSIPSGLKNILEWCVFTTVFSEKPVGLITASASGEKGHEELMLIMKTIQATFMDDTTLLIRGIKGKVDHEGKIKDEDTLIRLQKFMRSFEALVMSGSGKKIASIF